MFKWASVNQVRWWMLFNYWVLWNFQNLCFITLYLRRFVFIWGAEWMNWSLCHFANIKEWLVINKLYFRTLILLLGWFLRRVYFRNAPNALRGYLLPVRIWLYLLKERLCFFFLAYSHFCLFLINFNFILVSSLHLKLRGLTL